MKKPLHVFLIEDDPDDVLLLRESFNDNDVAVTLDVEMQGDKALPWLESCKHLPDVIVMDLNLPRVDGREILQKIKTDHKFKNIPVVILTTSSSAEDKNYCMSLRAAFFLTKPSTVEGFKDAVDAIATAARNNPLT